MIKQKMKFHWIVAIVKDTDNNVKKLTDSTQCSSLTFVTMAVVGSNENMSSKK